MKHIYIITFSLVLIACGNSEKKNEIGAEEILKANEFMLTPAQFTSEQMQLGKLEAHTFNELIKTSGIIDVPPNNKAEISAFMGGYITKTPLLIGDQVKKGQLLVSLENPEFIELQQQYLEISEQLNYLKSEFTRQETLFNEKITSQKNFLKSESDYKGSLASYNGLRKKLNMLNINPSSVEAGKITSTVNLHAPINGFVTHVNVSNGAYVSPADVIMEIVDTANIHIELSVFEKDILKLKKDQIINFKIPEASNETFQAKVTLVGNAIDRTSRIVKVYAQIIEDSENNFIVGMFVEANIITNSVKRLALPKEAILEVGDDFFALVLTKKEGSNYYFKKTKLDLGAQNEDFATVLNSEALADKEILIKGGYMLLSEGSE